VNGGGDAIVTDGDLPQIDLRALPVASASSPDASSTLPGVAS